MRSYNFGSKLERNAYASGGGPGGSTADYTWTLALGALLLSLAGLYLHIPAMGGALISFILFLWSKRFPEEEVRLYGIIRIRGTYLPFAMLLLDLVLGNPIEPPICGMLVGGLYHYIVDVLRNHPDSPLQGLHRYLETPMLLCYALGVEPTTRAAPGRPLQRYTDGQLRAAAVGHNWAGRGQRIGDEDGGGGGGGVGAWLATAGGWVRSGAAAVGGFVGGLTGGGGGGGAGGAPRPAPGFHPLRPAEPRAAAAAPAAATPPAATPVATSPADASPSAGAALSAEERRARQAAAAEARMKAALSAAGGGGT